MASFGIALSIVIALPTFATVKILPCLLFLKSIAKSKGKLIPIALRMKPILTIAIVLFGRAIIIERAINKEKK